MSAVATAIVGSAVVGGAVQSRSASKAARAQERAASEGIAAQDRALAQFIERTQPSVDLGTAAGSELANLLGLDVPEVQRGAELKDLQSQLEDIDFQLANRPGADAFAGGGAISNLARGAISEVTDKAIPGLQTEREGILSQIQALESQAPPAGQAGPNRLSQLEEINPLVSFLRDQGFEDIQESAAARGRLGAGGTLNELTEFNTNLASTVVPQLQAQRFNQLASILGIGTNAAAGQGSAIMNTGANTANLLGNVGQAQAQGQIGRANAITNTLGNVAGAFGAFGGSGAPQQPSPMVGGIQNPNRFEAFS